MKKNKGKGLHVFKFIRNHGGNKLITTGNHPNGTSLNRRLEFKNKTDTVLANTNETLY